MCLEIWMSKNVTKWNFRLKFKDWEQNITLQPLNNKKIFSVLIKKGKMNPK